MFDQIGKKIKVTGIIMFWLIIIGCAILGLMNAEMTDGASLIIIPISIPFAWCASCLIIGFGALIENVEAIRNKIAPDAFVASSMTRKPAEDPSKTYNINCPHCNSLISVRGDTKQAVCGVCGGKFDVEFE